MKRNIILLYLKKLREKAYTSRSTVMSNLQNVCLANLLSMIFISESVSNLKVM